MAQAKVLTEKEVRKVLLYIATKKHRYSQQSNVRGLELHGNACWRVGGIAFMRCAD